MELQDREDCNRTCDASIEFYEPIFGGRERYGSQSYALSLKSGGVTCPPPIGSEGLMVIFGNQQLFTLLKSADL
jgi:hypothetical protein